MYTFDWFKGTSISPLPQNSKYEILAPNTLIIKNVRFEDEGEYHCDVIVDDPMGNDEVGEGRNILVEVYGKFHIHVQSQMFPWDTHLVVVLSSD